MIRPALCSDRPSPLQEFLSKKKFSALDTVAENTEEALPSLTKQFVLLNYKPILEVRNGMCEVGTCPGHFQGIVSHNAIRLSEISRLDTPENKSNPESIEKCNTVFLCENCNARRTTLSVREELDLRDALFMGTDDVEKKVAIRFLLRHVLLKLVVVSQKHFEETGFFTPHLEDFQNHV